MKLSSPAKWWRIESRSWEPLPQLPCSAATVAMPGIGHATRTCQWPGSPTSSTRVAWIGPNELPSYWSRAAPLQSQKKRAGYTTPPMPSSLLPPHGCAGLAFAQLVKAPVSTALTAPLWGSAIATMDRGKTIATLPHEFGGKASGANLGVEFGIGRKAYAPNGMVVACCCERRAVHADRSRAAHSEHRALDEEPRQQQQHKL